MTRVAIALGSNMARRAEVLRSAVRDLGVAGPVGSVSSIYQTRAIGGPEGQDAYLNAVCMLDTDHTAEMLLDVLQGIEARWGRTRQERWGPRILDLDIVLFGSEEIHTSRLDVPHPRMLERRFVLEPLGEVWPDAAIGGQTVAQALERVTDQEVERIAGPGWVAMTEKGGAWLAGQAGIIVLLLLSLFDAGSLEMGEWAQWVGRVLVVVAAVLFYAGAKALGRNLTGYPEPTTDGVLVTSGVFRWIRHPLYTANIVLILGIALHQESIAGLAVAALAAGFFWMKAGYEEIRLSLRYPAYRDYMRSTSGRLVPGL